jgi:hypothetical protein
VSGRSVLLTCETVLRCVVCVVWVVSRWLLGVVTDGFVVNFRGDCSGRQTVGMIALEDANTISVVLEVHFA